MTKEEQLTAETLDLIYQDMGLFCAGWLVAQILFYGYEAHVPIIKRVIKFIILLIGLFFVRIFAGRKAFFGALLVMSAGMAVMHGYWFQYRNGIHWRTAEPRDRYLELIGEETA